MSQILDQKIYTAHIKIRLVKKAATEELTFKYKIWDVTRPGTYITEFIKTFGKMSNHMVQWIYTKRQTIILIQQYHTKFPWWFNTMLKEIICLMDVLVI